MKPATTVLPSDGQGGGKLGFPRPVKTVALGNRQEGIAEAVIRKSAKKRTRC